MEFNRLFYSLVRDLRKVLGSLFNKKKRCTIDKKMRSEVGKPLKTAEKLVKKAEKNNSRLASYDEKVRDPIIQKAVKTSGKRLPKPPKSVK